VRKSVRSSSLRQSLTGRRLHKEVSSFVEYISPSPMEHETRAMIISIIEKTITQKYPDAKVLPFGSFETKLYLPLG
jgi:non-canonical poly(A) RNA polymerase PAPD5/7